MKFLNFPIGINDSKLLIVYALIFFSCGSNTINEINRNAANIHSDSSNENFEKFNSRFHTDSLFQLSRINFPIDGQFADGENMYKWSQKNWSLMKEPVKKVTDIDIHFLIATH